MCVPHILEVWAQMQFGCRGLAAGYRGARILEDFTIDFRGGIVTTIIGPNGAGKSTLLKALYGLVRIDEGVVTIDDVPIEHVATEDMVRLGIAFVPQLANIFPSLSVRENLELGTYTKNGESWGEVFDLFPVLKDVLQRPAGRLSGGQRTMVAIGRALMSSPEVLLVDEPTAGLAPGMAESLWGQFRLLAQRGVAVAVVEQNVHLALANSDDAYLCIAGRNRLHLAAKELAVRDDLSDLFLEGAEVP